MVSPTLLVLDDELVGMIYRVLASAWFIAGVVFLFALFMFWFFRRFEGKGGSKKSFFELAFARQRKEGSSALEDEVLKPPAFEKKLKSKEDELKAKEDELKRRKRRELSDRARLLRKRELEEKVKRERRLKEREISLMRSAHKSRVSRHDWVRPSGFDFNYSRGYWGGGLYGGYGGLGGGGGNALVEEKERIQDLIDSAVNRFHQGEIEESSFSKMVLDYQRQLIDVEVKMRGSA